MRYLTTFACYGAHLHGDENGSVDPMHNVPGTRVLQAGPHRASEACSRMTGDAYLLDSYSRAVVLKSIQEVCAHNSWLLLAAHVRTNHVHVVVEAEFPPEKVMHSFKAYSSRALNKIENEGAARKRWARHGSTRWLWKDEDVLNALRYVVEGQGETMTVFVRVDNAP